VTPHVSALIVVLALSVSVCGCGSAPSVADPSPCANISSTALNHYDQMSAGFLDDLTRHPPDNLSGTVVWDTRYYLESLLIAYQATGNQKYIQAFLDSGARVMNLVQTISVQNVPDPTAPNATGPMINVTGWPTIVGNYGAAVPIPTADGKISLYAQNLEPAGGTPVSFFQVSQSGGGLELAWLGPNDQILQSNTITSMSDLEALAAQPLVWNEENGQSIGRIVLTGSGLPAVGQYAVSGYAGPTVFHEQTGGILLPFVEFLLIAKDNPDIADSTTLAQWKSKIVSVAAGYENQFISDGAGGLRFHNPQWLPNAAADVDSPADYIFMEARFRLLLYVLMGDPTQLSLARGLVYHQQSFHWQADAKGWLTLKVWPCVVPWTGKSSAPLGSIWATFQYDPDTPAPSTDASFVVDFLKSAEKYGLTSQLGIDPTSYAHQQAAFNGYMLRGSKGPLVGAQGVMRENFPIEGSTDKDPILYSVDPFAPAAWDEPDLSNAFFSGIFWNWIVQYGQSPQGYPPGYFLRAWARSEAAQVSGCQAVQANH
jgi:hypothetical protein